MKDEDINDLKKRNAKLENEVSILRRQSAESNMILKLLTLAGHLDDDKLSQAIDLAQSADH